MLFISQVLFYSSEITNSYIYMLMECGNLDLNTWLRNRKTVNPLERKFYWKNMLEAVQTIHKHGYLSICLELYLSSSVTIMFSKVPHTQTLHSIRVLLVFSVTFLCVGIVHSDLKPANFVIVNASLKLIDFGIANRIQPDVTSIMKDSQVRAQPPSPTVVNNVCIHNQKLSKIRILIFKKKILNTGWDLELHAP